MEELVIKIETDKNNSFFLSEYGMNAWGLDGEMITLSDVKQKEGPWKILKTTDGDWLYLKYEINRRD